MTAGQKRLSGDLRHAAFLEVFRRKMPTQKGMICGTPNAPGNSRLTRSLDPLLRRAESVDVHIIDECAIDRVVGETNAADTGSSRDGLAQEDDQWIIVLHDRQISRREDFGGARDFPGNPLNLPIGSVRAVEPYLR